MKIQKMRTLLVNILILALTVSFMSCNKDDQDDESVRITDLVGKWRLTHEEGYEIDNGTREEWNRDAGWQLVYTFQADNTGLYSYNDGSPGEWSFTWQYTASTRNLIVVSDEDPESPFSYTIEKLNSKSLVLVQHVKQNNFEYYQKSTYEQTD